MKSEFEGADAVGNSSAGSSNPLSKPNLFDHFGKESSSKALFFSGLFGSPFYIFAASREASHCEKRAVIFRSNGWATTVKRFMTSGSMRRIREQMLGFNKSSIIASNSDIWLLGVCYKVSSEDLPNTDPVSSSGFASFVEDFSSRILITYRRGFDPIGDSKYTSDGGWGCMLRSSQMLVAQALLVHRLGRSWRRSMNKQLDEDYIAILHLFGDSEESFFSIHNLLQAGKGYGLAAGSWVGPYAMCRTWETLIRSRREVDVSLCLSVYIVSGDEDGERGGAPILYIEDVCRQCIEHSQDEVRWLPTIFLVPLVLGLDKVNPRYLPQLAATFSFPQSVGILGGRPSASTYIVGVQDEKAFYLDPHEVQQIVKINTDNLEDGWSSYHCNTLRHFALESMDPSVAIGLYCRDKGDFDDLCSRASRLAEESNGAPLFTVAEGRKNPKATSHPGRGYADDQSEEKGQEDDEWQLL